MDALTQQNAAMAGVAQYVEWKRKFLADWQENIIKGQLKQAFALMPPEMKEELKKRDPEGYAMVLSMLGDSNAN